jgi:hypothetical protein
MKPDRQLDDADPEIPLFSQIRVDRLSTLAEHAR